MVWGCGVIAWIWCCYDAITNEESKRHTYASVFFLSTAVHEQFFALPLGLLVYLTHHEIHSYSYV